MNKAGRILFLLLLLVTMSLAQPLLDGYKSIKWNTPLAEVASKFPNASNCLISADSLAENKGTQLETMAGTEIFNEIQCLEVEEDDAGMLKSFKYLFSDSSFIGLLYSNEQANPDDVIKAVSAKYGTAKKNVLMDTTVMGFKTKATMYEWKGQKGSIRAQVIIADGTALYDNYMQQQAYQMGVSELEMEMAKAVMEEQRKQLMQISVIGPLYISNLFIQKQKHLAAKQPKPVQPKKPSISDDF
ncbi:MAG: hypothetical protein GX625_11090 [Clostridiaceae bacterium]|nr:hypothetical protein [Clostridiaceae bacterium]